MRIHPWAALVLLGACASASPAPAAPQARPAGPAAAPSADQIASDLRTVARGFGGLEDHIGRRALDELVRRLHGYPGVYLDAFEAMYVGGAVAYEQQADLFLPDVLAELQTGAPRRALQVARSLAAAYGNARVSMPREAKARERLEQHLRALETILGGVDVAPGPGWTTVTPDEVCLATVPGRVRRPALVVRRECTCGEVLACHVSASGTTLRVETYVDPHRRGCRDCSRAFTTCTLPALAAPLASYDLVAADGSRFGTLASGCAKASRR